MYSHLRTSNLAENASAHKWRKQVVAKAMRARVCVWDRKREADRVAGKRERERERGEGKKGYSPGPRESKKR